VTTVVAVVHRSYVSAMRQGDFFSPKPAPQVPGLVVVPDYISADEERGLLAHVDAGEWSNDFKRRVQVYGLGYGSNDDEGEDGDEPPPKLKGAELARQRRKLKPEAAQWIRDLPAWVAPLARRLVDDGHLPRYPENVVVNDYAPGVGIAPHCDYAPFGAPIVAVSLGSDVVLDFVPMRGGEKAVVHAPARSMWAVHGAARWQWKHGIAPRLSDVIDGVRVKRARRVSITFRVARAGPVADVVEGALPRASRAETEPGEREAEHEE
jgi:alkylated DNA repair dioxygenase AlkB